MEGTYRIHPADGGQRVLEVTITPVTSDGEVTRLRGAVRDITRRHERRQTRKQIETLFEHAQDSLFLVDVGEEFVVERVNPAWAERTGIPADQTRGHTPREILGEQRGQQVEQRYQTCVERGEPIEYEERLQFDGETTVWETRVAPVTIDGVVEYIAGVSRNVSRIRERERELERAERRFQAVFDDPTLLAGILDTDGTLVEPNPTAMEYIDAEVDEVTGEPYPETPWFPDSLQSELREAIDQAAEGKYVPHEAELEKPDGEPYYTSGIVRPVTDDDGDIVSLVVSARDITERKRREQELEELTAQYATLVEHFPDGGVFLFDHDLQYVRAGGSELSEVGLSSTEVEGQTPHDVFPADVADELARHCQATLRGEQRTVRQQYQGNDYEIRTMPIRDDTGQVVRGMAVSYDISEQVARKRELEEKTSACRSSPASSATTCGTRCKSSTPGWNWPAANGTRHISRPRPRPSTGVRHSSRTC